MDAAESVKYLCIICDRVCGNHLSFNVVLLNILTFHINCVIFQYALRFVASFLITTSSQAINHVEGIEMLCDFAQPYTSKVQSLQPQEYRVHINSCHVSLFFFLNVERIESGENRSFRTRSKFCCCWSSAFTLWYRCNKLFHIRTINQNSVTRQILILSTARDRVAVVWSIHFFQLALAFVMLLHPVFVAS
ncbi:unnamed protein product [Albugo candida]|uniref:Uncharacterized protein n=1 Tax=Albugo candida TaxID=65357 RepID=A0A024GQG4_9STRA|nr:unnamed protein product [Albugo candida]|eukprot:CCI48603.1 unnamed protein product [Albugo candida]